MERFCLCSLGSHLHVLTPPPLYGGCSERLDAFILFFKQYAQFWHQNTRVCLVIFTMFWSCPILSAVHPFLSTFVPDFFQTEPLQARVAPPRTFPLVEKPLYAQFCPKNTRAHLISCIVRFCFFPPVRAAWRGVCVVRCQTFSFVLFRCSVDHKPDWPACEVAFSASHTIP